MTLKILTILLLMFSLSVSGTVVWEEIIRLSCRSYYPYFPANFCRLPGTNSFMKLQVKPLQEFSHLRCFEGSTYGLAKDNSYIWVSGLCYAEFSIYLFTYHPNTEEPTTEEPTTVEQTTISAAPTATTNKPQSVNEICGQANSAYRIIGGTNATSCEYPWMAMISRQVNKTASYVCGGFIIDNTHILTAAHCVVSRDDITKAQVVAATTKLTVYTGSSFLDYLPGSRLTIRSVAKVTLHEKYINVTLGNDIAILTLSAPISFNTCQRPLCLVSATSSPQDAINCRVMGWGVTSNELNASTQTNLQWVDVQMAEYSECRSQYGVLPTDTKFCAGTLGKDSCGGDSGGPLACRENDGRYYAHGIVSYGLKEMCGLALGVYTKVSSFIPWIQSVVSITG